jgi:MATE family multidrug resistance protein
MIQFVQRVTLAFVGRYDPSTTSVAAAVLGSMYSNITGLSIGIGASMGLAQYLAANHGRDADRENGIAFWHCLRAQFFSFLFAVSMAGLSAPLLGALGQPEELLRPVQVFSLLQALAYPANWLGMAVGQALTAQEINTPQTIAQAVSSAINFSLSILFLANGFGFQGVAIANVIASWVGLFCLVAYVIATKRQETVWRIPADVDEGKLTFSEYCREAFPGAISLWAQWWAAEILALFAGLLGPEGVAANGVLFNTLAVFYMTFVAMGSASTFRVGFHVGAEDVGGIKIAIGVCMTFTVLLSVVVALVLQVYGTTILGFYTQQQGILTLAIDANPGMVLSIPPYAMMMAWMGIFRSAGLQDWAAKSVIVSFYLFGIPTGYYLGVVAGVGLLGIWLGNVTALGLSAFSLTLKVLTVDWHQVVAKSRAGTLPVLLSSRSQSTAKVPLLAVEENGDGLCRAPSSVSVTSLTSPASYPFSGCQTIVPVI